MLTLFLFPTFKFQTANEERIQALESELAEADARTQELEEALKREKAANNKLEKEHFIATEKMKEEQQDALKKANDEWVQERQVMSPAEVDGQSLPPFFPFFFDLGVVVCMYVCGVNRN